MWILLIETLNVKNIYFLFVLNLYVCIKIDIFDIRIFNFISNK